MIDVEFRSDVGFGFGFDFDFDWFNKDPTTCISVPTAPLPSLSVAIRDLLFYMSIDDLLKAIRPEFLFEKGDQPSDSASGLTTKSNVPTCPLI